MFRMFVLFLGSTLVLDAAWAETTLKITPEQARCIAKNVDTYFGYGTDPVIVVPDNCPNPPTNEELMAELAPQNSGVGFPTPKVGGNGKVLILLQSQLLCIRRAVEAGELPLTPEGFVEFSPENCID